MGTVCQLLPPSAYLALYHAATCVGKTTHKYFATMATYLKAMHNYTGTQCYCTCIEFSVSLPLCEALLMYNEPELSNLQLRHYTLCIRNTHVNIHTYIHAYIYKCTHMDISIHHYPHIQTGITSE